MPRDDDPLAREEMGMLKFVQDALDRSWIMQCESRERAIGAVNANLQEWVWLVHSLVLGRLHRDHPRIAEPAWFRILRDTLQ